MTDSNKNTTPEDTPLTDAEAGWIDINGTFRKDRQYSVCGSELPIRIYVSADFARSMERAIRDRERRIVELTAKTHGTPLAEAPETPAPAAGGGEEYFAIMGKYTGRQIGVCAGARGKEDALRASDTGILKPITREEFFSYGEPADQPPSEDASPRTDALLLELSDSPLNIETACEHLSDFARTLEREGQQKDARIAELARELADEKRGRESARASFMEDLRVLREFADRKESESAGWKEIASQLAAIAAKGSYGLLSERELKATLAKLEALAGKEAAGE